MRLAVVFLAMTWLATTPALAGKNADFNAAYREYTALAEAGKFAEAVGPAEKAYELGVEILGAENEQVGMLATNLGMVLFQSEQYKRAIKWTKTAIKIFEASYGKHDPRLIGNWLDLATIYDKAIMPDEEQRAFRKALKVTEENGREYDLHRAEILMKLGMARHFSHEVDMGDPQFKAAEQIYSARVGPTHIKTGEAVFWRGKTRLAQQRYRSAEPHFVKALEIFEQTPDAPSQFTLTAHAFLVQVYEEMGDDEKSTEHCIAAGRIQNRDPDDDYEPLYRLHPEYPYAEMVNNDEGEVVVEFTITAQGRTRDAKVVSSKGGRLFEKSALEALEKWRYAPTVRDGEPVETSGVQTLLTFRLTN